MREIKFRGIKKDGSFAYGNLLSKSVIGKLENYNHQEVNPNTVGQFIGLNDKNGKEIYEGDIVMCDRRLRVIKWVNGKYWFYANFSNVHEDISEIFGIYLGKVEIIGNIYENPNLLL